MKLKNVNALITGGSQGLGKVIAEHFLREGANVVICARNEKELSATRDELAKKFPAQKVSARDLRRFRRKAGERTRRFCAARTRFASGARAERRHLRADGADGIRFARRMAAGDGHQSLRRAAAVPRGHSAFQKGRSRQNHRVERRRRDESAAEHQFLRRVQGRRRPAHGNAGRGIEGFSRGRERDRARRAGRRGLWTKFWPPGRKKSAQAFFEKNKKWSEDGAVPLELGARLAVYLASAESDGITGKLISAQWDPWEKLHEFKADLNSDIYTLRRIVPKDRGKNVGRQMNNTTVSIASSSRFALR